MPTTYHGNIADANDIASNEFLRVNVCGVSSYSLGDYTTVREQGRHDYQLMYIRAGKVEAVINGESHTVRAGNVILYHPHEPQKYTYKKSDKYECIWVHFSGASVEKMLKDLNISDKRIFKIVDTAAFEEIINCILPEHRLNRTGNEYSAAAYVIQLLVNIARNKSQDIKELSTSRQKVEKVLMEMERNYTEVFPLEEYAKQSNLSPCRFSHIFSEIVGMSPHRYMIFLRLKKAKQLLRQTNSSVKEIAELSGFGNPMYFSRIFKKYIGCTPLQYRKSNMD